MADKTFFLDRDGTINVDYNFVHTREEWTWCDGAVEALRRIHEAGFQIVIVTNQSGIARGHYTAGQVEKLHRWVDIELEKEGVNIDLWLMAPHHPKFDPAPHTHPPKDRKPDTGMFMKADEQLNVDFSSSYMAGDKITDLQPAVELGITPFFIRSRHEPKQDKQWLKKHDIPIFNTLLDAVKSNRF